MQGKPSVDFSFDAEPERTLHARFRQTRQPRLADREVDNLVESDTYFDREAGEPIMAEATEERFLGDYDRANAPGGRLTIVNQPVNVENFQLHPTTIQHLYKRPFTGNINEDANKHLQWFLTMSTTLKIDGNSK